MQKTYRLLLLAIAFAMPLFMASTSNAQQLIRVHPMLNAIEVRDSFGHTVLRGGANYADDEFSVKLHGTGFYNHDAEGKARVELDFDDGRIEEQKVTLKVDDLAEHQRYDVFINGVNSGSFVTDDDGDAYISIDREMDDDDKVKIKSEIDDHDVEIDVERDDDGDIDVDVDDDDDIDVDID
jgi:hypothetical protein